MRTLIGLRGSDGRPFFLLGDQIFLNFVALLKVTSGKLVLPKHIIRSFCANGRDGLLHFSFFPTSFSCSENGKCCLFFASIFSRASP